MPPLLSIEGVSKEYHVRGKNVLALDSVDLAVNEGEFVTNKTFYVMGQICVDERYRGKGVFDALYLTHKELLGNVYELCVTSVSTRNSRSMKAHQRVGFEIVNTFQDATDEWNVLVWNFKGEKVLNKLFHSESL